MYYTFLSYSRTYNILVSPFFFFYVTRNFVTWLERLCVCGYFYLVFFSWIIVLKSRRSWWKKNHVTHDVGQSASCGPRRASGVLIRNTPPPPPPPSPPARLIRSWCRRIRTGIAAAAAGIARPVITVRRRGNTVDTPGPPPPPRPAHHRRGRFQRAAAAAAADRTAPARSDKNIVNTVRRQCYLPPNVVAHTRTRTAPHDTTAAAAAAGADARQWRTRQYSTPSRVQSRALARRQRSVTQRLKQPVVVVVVAHTLSLSVSPPRVFFQPLVVVRIE